MLYFGLYELDSAFASGLSTTDCPLLNNDQWYHVAATFDSVAGEVRFFLDGVEVSTISTSAEITSNDEPVFIGANWEEQKFWHGYLDDVRLYGRALNQEEIAEVMATALLGGGVAVADSYRDRFNSEGDYSGGDGSLSCVTDWLEIGETDGPDDEDEQVKNDDDNEFALRVRDDNNDGEGVQRGLDLSGCSGSELAFDYRRDRIDNGNDYVAVSVSGNGGSTWTELARFSGEADDSGFLHFSSDLSSYMNTNTLIRMLSSNRLGESDSVWFDNVDITCV